MKTRPTHLVIVESPAKAKTIQKYLGPGFVVKSSYGHVRDLPKSRIGVDVENNFAPKYVIPTKARKQITELKKAAASADMIYFATDEDREGEAIAWHLMEVLKPKPEKVKRITFSEITESAITQAVQHPRPLDTNLVDAQQARRVLDRLVGYELSPLLWRKVRRGLSAGRVQSVALRLIVEREQEITAFTPQEYWSMTANVDKAGAPFTAQLTHRHGQKLKKLDLGSKTDVDTILSELKDVAFTVHAVEAKEKQKTPPPPFTTSTLQQAAFNQLGFSSKKTMMLAQQLYEGVELGSEGPVGLITYMRTDSVSLANEALVKAKSAIEHLFGTEYALASPRFYKTKSKGAQEAHEAIRPTDPARTPDAISASLDPAQLKLYRLIWQRMVACQMAPARLKTIAADITAGPHLFRAVGSTVLFDGYVKALGAKAAFTETVLPPLAQGDALAVEKILPEQHFTEPPARFSEATLVKALEENGIGRPSTYAPTIDTLQRREYVTKAADKRLHPTEIGTLVNGVLTEHFANIVDVGFTAAMEEDLDQIAAGKKKWQPIISAFYQPFHATITAKEKELSKTELTQEKTGEICPRDGGELLIKLGRFGKFKACSNYPECKYTEPIGDEKELQDAAGQKNCPRCGRPLVVKRGRFGPFFGCSGYPECNFIENIEKGTGVTCPTCNQGEIIERRSRRGKIFYGCNRYPDCKTVFWSKPTGERCPICDSLLVAGPKNTTRCSDKTCAYNKTGTTPAEQPPESN